jgi:hypothetical protein
LKQQELWEKEDCEGILIRLEGKLADLSFARLILKCTSDGKFKSLKGRKTLSK